MDAPLGQFDASLKDSGLYPLAAAGISVFQINTGYLCNKACAHCHAEAGPSRYEAMSKETFGLCLKTLREIGSPEVDITGGAPEMNPHYRRFVLSAKDLGCRVKTRTNLTILLEKGYEDMPRFFASNGIEVVASLPYYLEEITDRQRGVGTFAASIEALKRLNAEGYGTPGSPLALNLVYNPCGAFLPPRQSSIEDDFRKELGARHGIAFTNLFTITNMPVGRFLKFLKKSGNLKRYMDKLRASYNPAAASGAMCTKTLSVGWDGSLYDCDFNQMLGLRCDHGAPGHLKDFDPEKLNTRRIVTGPHCYGCAAGAGSSCTGAVAQTAPESR